MSRMLYPSPITIYGFDANVLSLLSSDSMANDIDNDGSNDKSIRLSLREGREGHTYHKSMIQLGWMDGFLIYFINCFIIV